MNSERIMSYFRGLVMLVMVVEIVPGRNEILSSGLFYRRSPQLAKTPASCTKQAVQLRRWQLRLLCDPAAPPKRHLESAGDDVVDDLWEMSHFEDMLFGGYVIRRVSR